MNLKTCGWLKHHVKLPEVIWYMTVLCTSPRYHFCYQNLPVHKCIPEIGTFQKNCKITQWKGNQYVWTVFCKWSAKILFIKSAFCLECFAVFMLVAATGLDGNDVRDGHPVYLTFTLLGETHPRGPPLSQIKCLSFRSTLWKNYNCYVRLRGWRWLTDSHPSANLKQDEILAKSQVCE